MENRTWVLFILLIFNFSAFSGVLPPKEVDSHPFLSRSPAMHSDHYYSATTDYETPTGGETSVKRFDLGKIRAKKLKKLGMNICPNFMMDNEENLIGLCGTPTKGYLGGIRFHLALFDSDTMEKISTYTITNVKLMNLVRGDLPMNLGYFFMDNEGRAIVVNDKNEVHFVKVNPHTRKLELDKMIDLSKYIPSYYPITHVMPDYEGNYWFMSLGKQDIQSAFMGHFNSTTGEVQIHKFPGEIIENGYAMDATGVYPITDYALYKLGIDHEGKIEVVWKKSYERATVVKPGTISLYGSGASPSLMGDDLVTVTDNADGRVNLLVYNRHNAELICKMPLFKEGKSANENSVVAYNNSIVVQNWYNSPGFMASMKGLEPGIVRIDVREDRSGCDKIWENNEIGTTPTLKLSTHSGYLYVPIQDTSLKKKEKYYMAYLNFETGKVDYKYYLGQGFSSRFLYAPVQIGPKGKLIQPVFSGLITLQDKY